MYDIYNSVRRSVLHSKLPRFSQGQHREGREELGLLLFISSRVQEVLGRGRRAPLFLSWGQAATETPACVLKLKVSREGFVQGDSTLGLDWLDAIIIPGWVRSNRVLSRDLLLHLASQARSQVPTELLDPGEA